MVRSDWLELRIEREAKVQQRSSRSKLRDWLVNDQATTSNQPQSTVTCQSRVMNLSNS